MTISKENQSTSTTGTQTNLSAMTPNHHGSSPGHSAWSENSSTQKSYSTLPANFRKKGDGSIHPLPPPNGAISGSPKKKAGRSTGKEDPLSGPAKPGPINNTVLILPDSKKVMIASIISFVCFCLLLLCKIMPVSEHEQFLRLAKVVPRFV